MSISLMILQSGALSLVESFSELKYFHDVATPALLCHKEPARRIQSPSVLWNTKVASMHGKVLLSIIGALMP